MRQQCQDQPVKEISAYRRQMLPKEPPIKQDLQEAYP